MNTQFQPFPELASERMRLCRFGRQHFEGMFELRKSEDVMRYVERPRPESIADIEKMWESNNAMIDSEEGVMWVIESKEENKMMGTIGFWRMKKEHHRAEIGYMLLPQYWRKGYMSEALEVVLKFAFDAMQVHSIEADINPENEASAAILEKHGFVREAFFRENYFWKGVYLNSAIYSLLEQDYKQRRSQ
jgi:ribosomal-protein-alanine N-acetyltransferase